MMERKLIKNCAILDVGGQKVVKGMSILVDGSKIKKIGKNDEFDLIDKDFPNGSNWEIPLRRNDNNRKWENLTVEVKNF